MKCVFCGVNDGPTTDHIPPKCVFPTGQRDKSLTVPACEDCNCGSNSDDEIFKVLIGLTPNASSPAIDQKLSARTFETLKKNNKLTKSLYEKITTVPEQGILERNKYGFWEMHPVYKHDDTSSFERVAIKIGKGLYFNERKKTTYEDKIEVKILWNETAIGMEPAPIYTGFIKEEVDPKIYSSGHFKYWFTPNLHKDFDVVPVAIFDRVVFIVKYIKL